MASTCQPWGVEAPVLGAQTREAVPWEHSRAGGRDVRASHAQVWVSV